MSAERLEVCNSPAQGVHEDDVAVVKMGLEQTGSVRCCNSGAYRSRGRAARAATKLFSAMFAIEV